MKLKISAVVFALLATSLTWANDECSDCTSEEKRRLELIRIKVDTDAYKAIVSNLRELGENKEAALELIPKSETHLREALKKIDLEENKPTPVKSKKKPKPAIKKVKSVNWNSVAVLYAQVADAGRGIKGNVVLRAEGKDLQIVQGEKFNLSGRSWVLKNIKKKESSDGLPIYDVAIANTSGRIVKNITWK